MLCGKTHPCDKGRLCNPSLPTGPMALPALGRNRSGLKKSTTLGIRTHELQTRILKRLPQCHGGMLEFHFRRIGGFSVPDILPCLQEQQRLQQNTHTESGKTSARAAGDTKTPVLRTAAEQLCCCCHVQSPLCMCRSFAGKA